MEIFLLYLMYNRGLSTIRWNSYPRAEDVTVLDNIGYVVHIALFISDFSKKEGIKIDEEYIIKKIIFDSFKKLIISDINSATRDQLNSEDKGILDRLYGKIENLFIGEKNSEKYKWNSEKIREDFKKIFKEKKETEDKIIEFSRIYSAYLEVYNNSILFEVDYKKVKEEIRKKLRNSANKNLKISIFEKLVNEIDYPGTYGKKYIYYLGKIRRLSHANRWSQTKRTYKISVMSHLVIASFITYILSSGQKNEFEAVKRALYHDIPEAITGDIITPTKILIRKSASSEKIGENILDKMEEKMLKEQLFDNFEDKYFKNYYEEIKEYMLNPFNKNKEEGNIAKIADLFSALLEAEIELKESGNKTFKKPIENIKKAIEKKIKESNLENHIGINFLLKEGFENFGIFIEENDMNLEDFWENSRE